MFPEFQKARLLVHIAFHYTPARVTYLTQVLAAISRYQFAQVQVVIDTNSPEASALDLPHAEHLAVLWQTHENLSDPFQLTWQHRLGMAQQRQNYDYFMYLEDDMVVPFEALQAWRRDSELLHPLGYLRGFLRTEIDANGRVVSTDQKAVTAPGNYRRVGAQLWYYPENPYHATWVVSREQLDEFMDSPAWIDGNNPEWGVRERAAAGMTWAGGSPHRTLLPLNANGLTHEDARIRHLPNNYALDDAEEYGSLDLDTLHNQNILAVCYRAWLGLLQKLAPAASNSVD